MGTGETGGAEAAAEPGSQTIRQPGLVARLQEWVGFFWWQLGRSFTPLGVLAYFGALLVVLRVRELAARTWIYVLEIAFVLAAILQPVADGAQTDAGGWWLQMPYHTYTNFIFALLAGLGFVAAACWLFARVPRLAPLRYGLLALPLCPLFFNYDGCSQQGRWFGWQFGHDMLKDLPAESVVLGGTDPGRFVPTYMIFGESSQAPGVKRDPAFDRRDLYIITQNGVGEPLYRKYLADHYGPDRPQPRNVFERWLGRDSMYPVKPLVFPSEDEIEKEVAKEMQRAADRGEVDPSIPHSVVTRLIWEKNRDAHAFFVEESFPLEWSYGHAEPHGLVYKIHREPLAEIPAESVWRDFEFWDGYSARLLADPIFKKDYDAQRSFSKLRATGGNLYRHRKMDSEAERAYRQALALWQGNGESLSALSEMLWERGDFDRVLALFEAALNEDPNNTGLWAMYFSAEKRKEMQGEIAGLEKMLVENPGDAEAAGKLVELYAAVDDTNSLGPFFEKSIGALANNPEFLSQAVLQSRASDLKKTELAAAQALVAAEPGEAQNYFLLALAKLSNGDTEGSLQAAREAVGRGGLVMREALSKSPDFAPLRDNPEFQKITGG
jgi:tetratricopeptide (TPR) repeat protein